VRWLGGTRKTLVACLALAALGVGLAVGAAPATASDNPAAPALDHFIPASDQITSERQIHLTSNGPAQVVVQFQSAEPNAQGKTPVDLMILSWDHFAKRWVTIWDGAKVQSPDATSTNGGLTQDAVLPSAAFISNLTYKTITPVKGRTDLEFSTSTTSEPTARSRLASSTTTASQRAWPTSTRSTPASRDPR